MEDKQYDYLVFIGRMQPLHLGHMRVINQALSLSRKVIVLVGSSESARSPRNPFTFEERKGMLLTAIRNGEVDTALSQDRVLIVPISDFAYNDAAWIAQVQKKIETTVLVDANHSADVWLHGLRDSKIGLIGLGKDKGTAYYLKMFPEWSSVAVDIQHGTLNASDIRRQYFQAAPVMPGKHLCPQATISFLEDFFTTEEFRWLLGETTFYAKYDASKFPIFICCVDAVVIQSGHILLVERAFHPGKGLLALPGGHVEIDELFIDAAVRELKEETCLCDQHGEIPKGRLLSFLDHSKTRLFDDPNRSERGRVVTQAFYFNLPNAKPMFTPTGADDARRAEWYELGTLKQEMLFEDHWALIKEMTGAV